MSFTHKIVESYSTGMGNVATRTTNVADEAEVNYDDVVVAGAADVLVDVAFKFADVKAVCLYSDKDVTLETNAVNGAGGDVIALTAGVPLVWYDGARGVNPFTADVTKLYLTNAGASDANVKIRVLLHVTA